MELFYKFIIGGSIITLMSIIGKSKSLYFISGILPLIPALAIISYVSLVSSGMETSHMRKVVLNTIYTMPSYLIFLISYYYLLEKMSAYKGLLVSTFIWTLTVIIMQYFINFRK